MQIVWCVLRRAHSETGRTACRSSTSTQRATVNVSVDARVSASSSLTRRGNRRWHVVASVTASAPSIAATRRPRSTPVVASAAPAVASSRLDALGAVARTQQRSSPIRLVVGAGRRSALLGVVVVGCVVLVGEVVRPQQSSDIVGAGAGGRRTAQRWARPSMDRSPLAVRAVARRAR